MSQVVFNELLSLLLNSSIKLFVERLLELQCLAKDWSNVDNSHDEQILVLAENNSDKETECERVTEPADGEVLVKLNVSLLTLLLFVKMQMNYIPLVMPCLVNG